MALHLASARCFASAVKSLARRKAGARPQRQCDEGDSCHDGHTLVALAPGHRLGPYEIQALIGAGGMGEVYRGRDTRLGRDVALKVIAPRLADDASFRRRFELEARAASALNHPSIVTIYDVGETGGQSWIAMEWVEGRTLRHALDVGPLPVREAWSIMRQVADALAAAHAKGIVHRDLKPENVMLGLDGRARILDFGLARLSAVDALEEAHASAETVAAPERATFAGSILGTVGYMSPEQATGRAVDPRSDQFALGALAYEMLAGRQAFARPSAIETLSAIIREDPVPIASIRSDVSSSFQRVIARCLAKLPKDRFDSSRDLAAALTALDSRPGDVAPAGWPTGPESTTAVKPMATRRRAALAGAAVLAVVVAAIAWNPFTAPPARAIDSLAVLPFDATTSENAADYLGDGLTEALIDQMSRLPSIRVMARGTVVRFKGMTDPRAAGTQLGVGAVVTGRVTHRGDRLTISAELIETATGLRLWGETYDAPFADVLHVQDAIATKISEGLRLRLSDDLKRTLAAHGTENVEAYELLLKGRHLLANDTEEDDNAARDLFRKAIEKDPRFVEAHLEVAVTYIRSAGNLYAPPTDAWARAEESLKTVVALDPQNFRVRLSHAVRSFMFDWDWARAEREFQELSADPRLLRSNAYHPVAIYFWVRGRVDDAVTLMERALVVDPDNLESRVMHADFLAQAGRLDEAVTEYKAIVAAAPQDSRPLYGLADVLKLRGDMPGAIQTLAKAYELSDEFTGTHALASARTDAEYEAAEVAVARARLADLEGQSKSRYVSPLDIARLQAQIGNRDKAFASLNLALSERSMGLVHLKVDRAWDRIRDDPRFVAVVRRVGIP